MFDTFDTGSKVETNFKAEFSSMMKKLLYRQHIFLLCEELVVLYFICFADMGIESRFL
jgi:hypothetical protein